MPTSIRVLFEALLLTATACAGAWWLCGPSSDPQINFALGGLVLALTGIAFVRFGRPLERLSRAVGEVREAQPHDPVAALGAATGLLEHLHRLEFSFEDRIRARTHDIEREARAKDEFLSNTVHELRTPLTTIVATVEMLHEGMLTDEEDQRTCLEHTRAASNLMMFLLNDLLDTAAFEDGKLRVDVTPCDVQNLLHQARDVLTPFALSRQRAIEIYAPEQETMVVADPARTLQVLLNLVSNGLKYSPERSTVVLSVSVDGDHLMFEVIDEGIGVTEEGRANLFQRFQRVHDSSSSAASGTGIGLYISRALVEAMDGEIGHRHREGNAGSVFWFRLPLALEPARET